MAATACATSVGQSVPGAALQTARGDPPSARWARNAGAGPWAAQAASAAAESYAGGGTAATESFFSVAACRPGTASRSTSERVPA